jgi:hypothetical protein
LLFRKKIIWYVCGGVANVFYQSCAQIDNNQQVNEVQIQVPKCNSILKLFMSIIPNWRTTYIHYVRWVVLGLWSVCSPVNRSRWSGLSFWHRPLRYCYILAPVSVLHIPVDYYLSVHNSGKIHLPHHHIHTYIHTYIQLYHITFFWIAIYQWWLSEVFVIHIKVIRPCWYLGFYKLTTVYFLLSDLIDTDIANCHIVSNA